MKTRFAVASSSLILAFALSACGGGGVNGTPPPPTPTPTPTPPPTGVNDDLLAPLESETFANVAARAAASFNPSGTTGTAEQVTATIVFDATSDSYTLTAPTGSISFAPADIDSTQSSANALVYVKQSGGTTNSLTLTRPGTAGPLTYRYVGSAFWQKSVGSPPTSGSVDAIVYGVPTPDAAVPRTGAANYDIDLIGAVTGSGGVAGLAGTGTAALDLAAGNITVLGEMTMTGPGEPIRFLGNAKLAGASNNFTGTLTFGQSESFNGTLAGKLFGPAAEEIGAAWAATSPDGRVAVGTFMGRRGAADVPNTSFEGGLANSETFNTDEVSLSFKFDGDLGHNQQTGDFKNISSSSGPLAVRYAGNGYYFYTGDGLTAFREPENTAFPTEGSSTRIFYGPRGSPSAFPGFNPKYVRREFMIVEDNILIGPDGQLVEGNEHPFRTNAFVFGFPTGGADVPRIGTAKFDATVIGFAIDNVFRNPMDFGGRGELAVDFAAGTIGGTIPIDYRERDYGGVGGIIQTRSGNWAYNGQISASANAFSGNVTMTGLGAYSGSGSGRFYGPGAGELGGVFHTSRGADGHAIGNFLGIAIPAGTLQALPGPTVLTTVHDDRPSPDGTIASITYDPSNKSYAIAFDTGGVSMTAGPGSARSDNRPNSAFHNFEGLLSNSSGTLISWLARMDNIAGTAPAVALSYMNFGRIFTDRANELNRRAWDYHLFATGLQTASMPTTGTASYEGATTGFVSVYRMSPRPTNAIYQFDGTMGLSANFASGTLSATFSGVDAGWLRDDMEGAHDIIRAFEGFTLGGTITGTSFSGSATQGDWLRAMNGAFFGPNAAEVGGTYSSYRGTPGTSPEAIQIDGSFGAKKD